MEKEFLQADVSRIFPSGKALAVHLNGYVSNMSLGVVSEIEGLTWLTTEGDTQVFTSIDNARYKDVRIPIKELVPYKSGYLTAPENANPQFFLVPDKEEKSE